MSGDVTLLWLAGIVLVFQLVVVTLSMRYRATAATAGADAEVDPEEYVHEDEVECPECGVRNELGYRFCRECVGELPGSMSFADSGSVPAARGLR